MKKRWILWMLAILLLLGSCAPAITMEYFVLEEDEVTYYSAAAVREAVFGSKMNRAYRELKEKTVLEGSMDIKLPRLNWEYILVDGEKPIAESESYQIFADKLKAEKIEQGIIEKISLAEYYSINDRRPMDEQNKKMYQMLYPQLKEADLSDWTVRDQAKFDAEFFLKAQKNKYSKEQLKRLEEMGIKEHDLPYLLKQFDSASLDKATDAQLKEKLESYYAEQFDRLFGAGSAEKYSK